MGKTKKGVLTKYPLVSICTPTFNRRPFIPMMIKCFEHQTYPKNKIEWIIVDDGSDKIEDLVSHIPEVKYFKYDEKMTLGKKRNLLNEKCSGEIIIFMDDDDYYPPERISHAVDRLLKNPKALCAGSSDMYIYFKHISKMYKFGPYGPNHSTAATFAFKRELLKQTSFDENSSVAEERNFLKEYTIPFVQLDSFKTILVFSHNYNSFDKKELLVSAPNKYVNESQISPSFFIKNQEILQFFMEDIDIKLELYEPGKVEYKPDVIKQLKEMRENREKKISEMLKKQEEEKNLKNFQIPNEYQKKINEQGFIIQELTIENNQFREKIKYLETKITDLIKYKINNTKKIVEDDITKQLTIENITKKINLSQESPIITINNENINT